MVLKMVNSNRICTFLLFIFFSVVTIHSQDSIAVRAILDSNEFHSLPVDEAVFVWGGDRALKIELWIGNMEDPGNIPTCVYSIPPDIGQLTALRYLYIDIEEVPYLPSEFCNLTDLVELTFDMGKINNSLPAEFWNLNLLEKLDLCAEIDTLPAGIGNLTQLKELSLSGCGISKIPPEIGNLKDLTFLDLFYNNITELPKEIGNLTNLTMLGLLSNNISTLPSEIGNLTKLTTLYLDNNNIAALPTEIGNLSNLNYIDLSFNKIENLPPGIGRLKRLGSLKLRDNKLSNLPDELCNLDSLSYLTLSNNSLQQLPSAFGNFPRFTSLLLDNNNLKEIPESIEGCKNVRYVALDHNDLTDLPESFSELDSLTRLILTCNKFETIPSGICNLPNLGRLKIDSNTISSLSDDIGKLTTLTELDLSNNKLTTLPDSIVKLQNIFTRWGLDIGYNYLNPDKLSKEIQDWADIRDEDWRETQYATDIHNPYTGITTQKVTLHIRKGSIVLNIPTPTTITLQVFDIQGRTIKDLVKTVKSAGHHSIGFDYRNLSNGTYFVHLQAGDEVITKRIAILR